MKRNKLIYTIMFVCTLVATSCSNEEDINLPVTKGNIRFNFSDSGVHNTVSTKAATDKEYQTTFEEGDKIGLYAFANEETTTPIEGYNNVCLTYQNREWVLTGEEGSASLNYDTQLKDAVFHAYYPYQESVTLSGTPNSPFTTLINGWVINADKSYTENDLMTGSGTASTNKNDITVSIALKHEMAMIVVGLSGGTTYKFTNQEPKLSDYTASSGEATFSINDTDVTSLAETINGKYRFLVKPDTDATLNVSYGGKTYTQENVNIPASKYQEYSIGSNSSSEPIEFELSVGDYYCSDGTLIESDAELSENIKSKIIGVVYYVGNPQPGSTGLNYNTDYPDILAAEHPSCTHGLVYAIKSVNTDAVTSWGDGSFGDGKVSGYYEKYNYKRNTAPKYIWETSSSNYGARMLGYDYTAVLTANKVDYPTLFQHLDQTDAPSVSSGWYLPSYGELKLLATGTLDEKSGIITIDKSAIETSLSNIGGEALFEKTDAPYASSTFNYPKNKETFGNKIQVYTNTDSTILGTTLDISKNNFPHHLRFSLAF